MLGSSLQAKYANGINARKMMIMGAPYGANNEIWQTAKGMY